MLKYPVNNTNEVTNHNLALLERILTIAYTTSKQPSEHS